MAPNLRVTFYASIGIVRGNCKHPIANANSGPIFSNDLLIYTQHFFGNRNISARLDLQDVKYTYLSVDNRKVSTNIGI